MSRALPVSPYVACWSLAGSHDTWQGETIPSPNLHATRSPACTALPPRRLASGQTPASNWWRGEHALPGSNTTTSDVSTSCGTGARMEARTRSFFMLVDIVPDTTHDVRAATSNSIGSSDRTAWSICPWSCIIFAVSISAVVQPSRLACKSALPAVE